MTEPGPETFAALDSAVTAGGPRAALDHLVDSLREAGRFPELFEALLMRRRHELGLPLEGTESLRDLPEELQETVESFYIEACREVGRLFLESGNITGAWPYFRAIDEPGDVARAIESWSPPVDDRPYDPDRPWEEQIDPCDQIVDIAFHQGAHPVRGYGLILERYGTCRAITIFDHNFPHSATVKEACARHLVNHLYEELLANLRADLERRGAGTSAGAVAEDGATGTEPDRPTAPDGADRSSAPTGADRSSAPLGEVRAIVEQHPELFGEHGYHIDISHLQSVVRAAAGLPGGDELAKGIELCEYGRRLGRDFQSHDPAPFEDFYDDYRILLRAFSGEGVDGAVRYFRSKAERTSGPDEYGQNLPGEVLVVLLDRVGRHGDAVDAWLRYLADLTTRPRLAPPLATLCERATAFERLREHARARGDLLQYAAALLKDPRHRERG